MTDQHAHARPRVAILGLHLEANRFAPVTTGDDFRAACWLEGEAILAEARKPAPAMPAEIPGFVMEMDATGPWTPVPVIVTSVEPGGPADGAFIRETLAAMRARLAAAAPIDAVYLSNHGAMMATDDDDPDGAYYAMAREAVGPGVPVVSTVDLHANVSARMVEAADAIVAYRTNPHVDQRERAAEAARLIRRMLGGLKLVKHFARPPIAAPSVRLLTAEGPYADLVKAGQQATGDDVPLVSVIGGFAWADVPHAGLSFVAYGDAAADGGRRAGEVVAGIARDAWADRERYRVSLTPVAEAVAAVMAAGRGERAPVCLADVADNPGGGGRGNTTALLEALLAARPARTLFGLFIDARAAARCHAAGVGAAVDLTLNEGSNDPDAPPVPVTGRVTALSDGTVVGRRGIYRGRTARLGPAAALEVGGITIVLSTRRVQCAEPLFFEHLGLDIGAAAGVVVKSRGHFRAGFDEFFTPDRILEVDAPGLTSPNLGRFAFSRLRRPIFPLDEETPWTPPA